jgi:hypothetical protein
MDFVSTRLDLTFQLKTTGTAYPSRYSAFLPLPSTATDWWAVWITLPWILPLPGFVIIYKLMRSFLLINTIFLKILIYSFKKMPVTSFKIADRYTYLDGFGSYHQ